MCVLIWLSIFASFVSANEFCDKDGCEYLDKKCFFFDRNNFGAHNKSIFLIESKGRLGNHLIAYTLIQALAKELEVEPMIVQETHDFIDKYFQKVNVPVYQRHFCNWQSIPIQRFLGGIDDLVGDKSLVRGHVLDLWPFGYKPEVKICCPAEELQKYMQDHFLEHLKKTMIFKSKYQDYADRVKADAAAAMGVNVDDAIFVGIHNRRTDYMDYMRQKFGVTKSPYNKKYFQTAMEYFREDKEDEGPVIFLLVSDDMEWSRSNIKNKHKDLFFVGSGNPDDPDSIGYDLCVLASCDHTIITWGSFSMWSAMLSGGEYYTDYGVIVPRHLQHVRKRKKKL